MAEVGTCRLCGIEGPLLSSHIIPKFVFRWLKETGGTDYLRVTKNINRRTQDGIRYRMLCAKCEAIFNAWETTFANRYFYPATRGEWPSGTYDSWLSKFCASVVWRIGIWGLEREGLFDLGSNWEIEILRALECWKGFVRGEQRHPGKYELHLIPVGEFSRLQRHDLPGNWNRYTRRYVEIDFSHTESRSFGAFFVKMGPIAVFGHITNEAAKWIGTRVAVNHGNFVINAKIPDMMLDYLIDRANKGRDAFFQMSERQAEITDASMRDNLDRLSISDFFSELEKDVRQFGQDAFVKRKGS